MKRLIIAPHVDDDVLGCGGLLAVHGSECVVFYCGVDSFHIVPAALRRIEALNVLGAVGARGWWPNGESLDSVLNNYLTSRRVNEYDVKSLIDDIEMAIERERPDQLYVPWPSYNQDHRAVYEAALIATRPHDVLPFVSEVYAYEETQVTYWDHAVPGESFNPTAYLPLTDGQLNLKIGLYRMMPSQMRAFRSVGHLRALARLRGGAITAEAAEAYVQLRGMV